MNVSRITIGRLYNLGSYEHVRYELTVDVKEGESPGTAILGMEKILSALSPKTCTHSRDELLRDRRRINEMRRCLAEDGHDEFKRINGYHIVGTPEEYIQRCEESHAENVAKRDAWEARSEKARKMLEDLGGAANWKDAKLEWEDDNEF